MNRICPHEKCDRYEAERDKDGNMTKRSCYYAPGCFRGDLVVIMELMREVEKEMVRKVRNR